MTLQARYTILRKIADGGTAEIFLATQRGAHGFEKPVVLKRIFPAFYADPQFRNMLVDEAHIAMSLNHSNIVQVLDLGEADGQYVLALELVDGWTLDAVLRRARALKTSVPPALALYMTAEVCRALAYAHAKVGPNDKPLGIVHRDISPHNLLLSEQGEVKLTDFGIAKAHNRRDSSLGNIIKGKIAYMSPEQASGAPIDARSDLFSVGTMLYVMVCHRYPFDAPTDLEVLLLVKNGEYEPPEKALPGLNPEIYRVIKRAMSKAPVDRYQRAEEMLIDVEHVMRVAFRAVGQTELKRWLQDLSMRDGVPPLTRMPISPSSATAGRAEGETLELKGVGTTSAPATLPPPALGPRANQPPPAPARAGTTGNKSRPPPPPAAMNVGKTAGPGNNPAVGIPMVRPPGPGSEPTAVPNPAPASPAFTFGVGPSVPPSETQLPEEEATEVTPTPLPRARQSGHHLITAPGSPRAAEAPPPMAVAAEATEKTLPAESIPGLGTTAAPEMTKADAARGAPVAPRKSSSWVAQAVMASAQRAGTTPAPPVGNVVPPPPVSGVVPSGKVSVPADIVDTAPVVPPAKNRVAIIASAVAVAAVLVSVISMRACRKDSTEEAGDQRLRPREQPAKAIAVAAPVAHARAAPEIAPAVAAVTTDAGISPVVTNAAQATRAANEPTGVPDRVAPDAATINREAMAAATGAGGTGATREIAVVAPAAAMATGAAPAATADEPTGGNSPPSAESEGDADGGTAPAPVLKVQVLLNSSPPGAQVGTARRSFGTAPVSAKLKVGRTYALIFTLDGYRSVTKQFRVANFSDQEVTAVLHREAPAAKSPPAPPANQSATPAKPDKNWFQRMFAR